MADTENEKAKEKARETAPDSKLKQEFDNTQLANETADDSSTENNLKIKKHKKKRKKPENQILKKLIYKKTKLVCFKDNYGANVDVMSRFFIKEEDASLYEKRENEKKENVRRSRAKDKKRAKKKKLLNFLYFALNIIVIAIVLAVQLSGEDNPLESLAAILDVNWGYIAAAVATFFVCMIMDQIKFAVLIKKATGVYRFNLAYKVAALGRHYDVITPLSTGGQPFQIFYTSKYGIKAGQGVSIAMGKYIFQQIVYFICVSLILFGNLFSSNPILTSVDPVSAGLVGTLSWIGYALCAGVIAIVVFVSLNRRAGTSFVVGILKLLSKIKIGKFRVIKDYKKTFVSAMRTVNSWQSTTREYRKSFWVVFVNIVTSLIYLISWYSMPFFIYCAFPSAVNSMDTNMWLQIITIAVMVDLSSAFNPIPMGVGTADLSFTVLYGGLFATGAQVWALIIWRILAFYIYILQGSGVLIYDYLIGDKRLAKYKDFWQKPYRERVRIRLAALRVKNRKKD